MLLEATMEETGTPVYPYEYDKDKRAISKRLSRAHFRLNLISTLFGAAILLALVFTGASESYSQALAHYPWQWTVALYSATLISFFFLIELLFSFARYRLRRKYGMTTQSMGRWLEDQAKGYTLSLLLSLPAVEFLFLLILDEPGYWWFIAASVYIILSFCYSTLFPLLFARFFYQIRPLQDGEVRDRVKRLLSSIGLERFEVFTLNESSRSRGANAFVTGIGGRKRVVIFDNLLNAFAPPEVDSIVAHELGHYVKRDTTVSMVMGVATTYVSAYLMYLTLAFALGRGVVYSALDPTVLLWFVLFTGILGFALSPLMNAFSRSRERRADMFSLDLTRDPVAFISGEKRLCDVNLMDESVKGLRKIFFATHPSTLERVAMGENWRPSGLK